MYILDIQFQIKIIALSIRFSQLAQPQSSEPKSIIWATLIFTLIQRAISTLKPLPVSITLHFFWCEKPSEWLSKLPHISDRP